MKRTILRAAPVVALAGVAAVMATGSPATAKSTLRLKAVEGGGDSLKFSKSRLTTSAGKVTIAMSNPKGNDLPHAIKIGGKSGKVVQAGGTSRVTVRLKKGRTYTFFCPVGDHRADGMVGKIVVK